MKARDPRGMHRPPPVRFTMVEVNGNNGKGSISLKSGVLWGPFSPESGDQIVRITSVYNGEHAFDDDTGFASEVGDQGSLYQYDPANLSGDTFLITIARVW